MKTTFTYTILRYVHDIATGEFVNMGLALYAPEAKYVSATCSQRYGRLSKMFLDVNGEHLRSLIRYIQARFEAFDTGRTSLFTPTASGGTGNTPTNGGPVVGGPWYGFLARRVRTKISGPIGSSGRSISRDDQVGSLSGSCHRDARNAKRSWLIPKEN